LSSLPQWALFSLTSPLCPSHPFKGFSGLRRFSSFFTYFHLFSAIFITRNSQQPNIQHIMTKPRSDSFAEKISPDQRLQLIDWLSDHSYSETCELIAAPPPDGF